MNAAHSNQSNHGSNQVNIGEHKTNIYGPAYLSSPMTPNMAMAPMPHSPPLSFSFGSIIPPDSEPNEEADPAPIKTVPPTMSPSQKRAINTAGITIQRKYHYIIEVSKRLRRKCVVQLRRTAMDQRLSLERHLEAIRRWPEQTSEYAQGSSQGDVTTNSRRDCIQKNLDTIEKMVKIAADQVPGLLEYCQDRQQDRARKRPVNKSSNFQKIEESINKVQNCITAIESEVFQHSPTRRPLESTQGFARLFIASLATRTLYRCLCKACPLAGYEKGHDRHSALVCLVPVPGKEPSSIKPNEMALIAHLIAIESTLDNGLIWFEANSTLRIPCTPKDVIDGSCSASQSVLTDLRTRRDSGYSTSSSKDEFSASRIKGDSGNNEQIQVCPGSLAQGNDHLAMCIGDEESFGHQIYYLREDRRPKLESKPLLLSHIIEQGQLRSDVDQYTLSHRLKAIRFQMATRIAEATLRYGWSEWLGETWDSGNVVFYPVGNDLLPFLSIQMGDRGCINHGNFLSCLGIVLLEVGLWEELKTLKQRKIFEGELIQQYLTRLLKKSGAHYQEVVQYCLQFPGTGNGGLDDGFFQETFYQKVVSPLKKLASL
ncbi:hypothetical protein G7Z17_g230 [Cylindrodendrum hubeiense]|uniref:Uncharacterized protein n=1 Tax=Cylindrodendrum hubeiense TaxID=595255 RepID=A0A9P5HH48_9HYPO|nr:hypothetical protein G7Z17_g230 [Cylindrodendrum hubeiense]